MIFINKLLDLYPRFMDKFRIFLIRLKFSQNFEITVEIKILTLPDNFDLWVLTPTLEGGITGKVRPGEGWSGILRSQQNICNPLAS